MNNEQRLFTLFERQLADVLVKALSRRTTPGELSDQIEEIRVFFSEVMSTLHEANLRITDLKAENIRLQENINVLIQLNEANNDSQIKDELQVRIDKAINLLQDEMGDWLPIGSLYLPDHYLQLRHILDVLRGDGE